MMTEPCRVDSQSRCLSGCNRFHVGHALEIAQDPGPRGDQYRRHWRDLPQDPKADKGPGFLKKVATYIKSTIRYVADGMTKAPLDVQEHRAAVCQACPYHKNNTCSQCGCATVPTLIGDKLARASEACPVGKWPAWKPAERQVWQEIFRQGALSDLWPTEWWAQAQVNAAFRVILQERIAKPSAYPGTYHGRGMLVLGGGPRYAIGAYVSCSMARHTGYHGPIQIWHRGDDEPIERKLFDELDVEIVNAYEVLEKHHCRRWGMDKWEDPGNRWLSWGLKSYAALHCPFEQVLYMDADAYPVTNIDEIFESNPAGTVIWYDLPGMESNIDWHTYGIDNNGGPGWQGGQWLIDKRQAWPALELYRWLDDWSDYTYRFGYGDQDNMKLAWIATGTPYHVYPFKENETTYVQPKYNCLRAWGPKPGTFCIYHRVPDKTFEQDFRPRPGNLRTRHRFEYEDKVHEYAERYRQLAANP